jgi:PAS domain S-box-containing protein
MSMVMVSSITVLLLTVAAFMIYDLITYRANMLRNLSTLAQITADYSSAALAFRNDEDAIEVLSGLRAEPQILGAALYDPQGNLFVAVTNTIDERITFPSVPPERKQQFSDRRLYIWEPISQSGTQLGMLCLAADLRFYYDRLHVYAVISALIVMGAMAVVLILSNRLQKRISEPIMALAGTATRVSEWNDYSVRAPRLSDDELGTLTDAFNQMLSQIEEQTIALQEGRERLSLALQASQTGVWDWNLQRQEIKWDDPTVKLYGLRPGEFKGTYEHALSLIRPEDRNGVAQAVAEAIAEKKELRIEFAVVWPDGSVHDMATRAKAFYDSTGKPVRMIGVTQDVTERKRADEASRRLAAIVQFSDDAIISKNLSGIIQSWNKGAERLFGYTAEEAIGQPIMNLIIPTDRAEEEQQIIERIRRAEPTDHYQTIRRRKDGTFIDVSITVSPVRNESGTIVGASKIARDITDMKQTQAALENQARMLGEQAQMLDLANVMARELDGRIFLWNTGMEKMYGWSRTETIGRISHELLKTRFPRPLEEIKAALMTQGAWEGEVVHIRKDGKPVTVASQWVLHKDDKGEPLAIIEVNTDITERKAAEQQVMRMNAELEQRVRERTAELTAANQELEAFTYSVAHDLRAPLRHIDAFTKIIFDDFAPSIPPEAARYLENIRKGSQNMSRLVDDLLNLARVSRQELKRELTPLNPVVEEVVTDLKRETEHRQVEWHISPLPSVQSDAGLIKQVFTNLLSNAVKYTRPREKAIIEVGQKKIDGATVIFVRDNGVGFNMKYADKLFGVFQRLHRADEFEGTGIGLATVDRIIRKHGGRIWAEAEMNKGATFYLRFNGIENTTTTTNGEGTN